MKSASACIVFSKATSLVLSSLTASLGVRGQPARLVLSRLVARLTFRRIPTDVVLGCPA